MANIIEYTSPEVEVISGGHIVLGPEVTVIRAIKRVDFTPGVDISVKEYELPTRIDFQSATPPLVINAMSGAISSAELHVPSGALDTYVNHPQWGKAAYFVDAEGNAVDKYAAKHRARLKKIQKDREAQAQALAEKTKKEKVEAIGTITHSVMAKERLAKWEWVQESSYGDSIDFKVKVPPLWIEIGVPKIAPVDIWDSIVSHLEEIENKLK